MKQRTQWIAALFTAASACLAVAGPGSGLYGPFGAEGAYGGFGPYSQQVIEPVGERIIQTNACDTGRVVLMKRSTYVMRSSPAVVWSEPANPAQVVGNVITAPFRLIGGGLAWTGRTLSGQPDIVASRTILEPVGERVTTVTTKTTKHMKCGKKVTLKKVTFLSQPALMPVGERFTTVKVFRSSPMLEPVGERIITTRSFRSTPMLEPVGERLITVKTYRSHRLLAPVGEKITTVKYYRGHRMLAPVGEKITTVKVIHGKRFLAPVGERITTVKTYRSHRLLAPVGERTWIRTTRVMSAPSCGCW
ncbi:MAG: hypothetical protein PHQ12_05385 [Chthoniobacteraceae bacterium]|nr:hypothetical protein [Chthoniobacteraceae bacterium]